MINIIPLISAIHNAEAIERHTRLFLQPLQEAGLDLNLQTDLSVLGYPDVDVFFVCTGGTENMFLQIIAPRPEMLHEKVYLLSSGTDNSLAASVEILSWLRQNGHQGEIIHGCIAQVAERLRCIEKIGKARQWLAMQMAAVIGKPSDWLIASHTDYEHVRQTLGINIYDIGIEELLAEIKKAQNSDLPNPNLLPCDSPYFRGALTIYQALRTLLEENHMNALTLRCFDLLSAVRNTGCLALAMLNAEGIPAACEGDVPAMLTMMTAQALTGQTGFQANPSRINPDTGEVVFAHCTVPLNMVGRYSYDTHFESGIGVAIHGEMPEGDATLFKLSGDGSRYFAEDVRLLRNGYENNLCRTQVTLQTSAAASYLLHRPIGNHHIILTGHHCGMIDAFMEEVQYVS